ncbi:MAG: hypothetical protein M3R49_05700 [Chloroflexota bacterium]|nr:hypothetical protein [Chloroflexota bacterium]
MADLTFAVVDASSFDAIPDPAQPGARCQTCDYWERLDGSRSPAAADAQARADLKRSRLLAGAKLAGAYAMLAHRNGEAVGYAQFGPMSVYPRAQSIRARYPQLPDSPAPWVVTCLQVVDRVGDHRQAIGAALLDALGDELDRRGIGAVEAYPEGVADPWLPSPGPASLYAQGGFEQVAGDDRYPVYRRELTGSAGAGWTDLLERTRPADEGDDWPLPLPRQASEDDLFRLPPKLKRTNPFGDD